MRRNALLAATLALLSLAPGMSRAASSYSLIMAGSRCASAATRSNGLIASAWVCTGVQLARTGTEVPDPAQAPSSTTFGCIALADFTSGSVQRACGVLPDGAIAGDPALQTGKIEFFLTHGDQVLAARINLTGIGPYLNDHLLSEFGSAGSNPAHSNEIYAVARIYRMAKVSGFIMGDGISAPVRGSRASMSTGVAGIARIDADPSGA